MRCMSRWRTRPCGIGPAPAADSYLNIDAVIDAVHRTGRRGDPSRLRLPVGECRLRRGLREAGVVFVGPPPGAIRAMGSKSEAKALDGASAGVPLVPGYHGDDQDDADLRAGGRPHRLSRAASRPSAGGGGKGMRRVDSAERLRRGAGRRAARGQGRLRRRPRADREISCCGRAMSRCRSSPTRHGNAVHLFERDCSVQRRHQKVIEEAPAPGLTAELRRRAGRGGGRGGQGRRLCRRRHRRVPARSERRSSTSWR